MRIRAELGRQRYPLCPAEHQVDRIVNLSSVLYAAFLMQPLDCYEFIEKNAVEPHQGDGVIHCLLALGDGRTNGVLIQCGIGGRATRTAYVAGARDVVQARLDRAADFIVRQGTEHTASGYWCFYCEELTEKFGLTISEGSGLDTMLKDTLERRPEVAAVDMANGAIEATFRPEFCRELKGSTEEKRPDIRVRDILPLLSASDPSAHPEDPCKAFLTHPETDIRVWPEDLRELTSTGQKEYAGLLNAPVSEIVPTDEGIKVVLTDVAPEELARFNQDYEAHQAAEQAMGPIM